MTTLAQKLLFKLNRTLDDLEKEPAEDIAPHTDVIRNARRRLSILHMHGENKQSELEQS